MYAETARVLCLYYRTANDVIPLGQINVAHATFTFDIVTDKRANIFEIRCECDEREGGRERRVRGLGVIPQSEDGGLIDLMLYVTLA